MEAISAIIHAVVDGYLALVGVALVGAAALALIMIAQRRPWDEIGRMAATVVIVVIDVPLAVFAFVASVFSELRTPDTIAALWHAVMSWWRRR